MDFDFSSEEKMVRDQVDRYLMNNCENGVFRSVLEGEGAYSVDVWRGLVEMGVPGTAISAEYGGVGAGYSTLCLVAEQLGAYLAPTPFSSSIYLAAEAIQLFGSEDQKQTWLPKLAAGEVIGTLAVTESTQESAEDNIQVSCSDGKLSGRKLIVPHAGIADLCVVVARDISVGVNLYLVDLGDAIGASPGSVCNRRHFGLRSCAPIERRVRYAVSSTSSCWMRRTSSRSQTTARRRSTTACHCARSITPPTTTTSSEFDPTAWSSYAMICSTRSTVRCCATDSRRSTANNSSSPDGRPTAPTTTSSTSG